jgi:hypothetical protein
MLYAEKVAHFPSLLKMEELLEMRLNQLTDEEKKQVQQFWNKKKPYVPFTIATLVLDPMV